MEENKIKKLPVTWRDVVADWGVGSFFGFYIVYHWLGTDDAKADIVAAFGVQFFAMTKAGVLLASMFFGVLGGYRLFKILMRVKKTIRFIDTDEDIKK